MSNFVPEKVFLRGVLLYYFNMKKTAAQRHRILVEVYGEHALAEQKIICETRTTRQINGKAEYPWREGNALYLVGSEGCAVLRATKTIWKQWMGSSFGMESTNCQKGGKKS